MHLAPVRAFNCAEEWQWLLRLMDAHTSTTLQYHIARCNLEVGVLQYCGFSSCLFSGVFLLALYFPATTRSGREFHKLANWYTNNSPDSRNLLYIETHKLANKKNRVNSL